MNSIEISVLRSNMQFLAEAGMDHIVKSSWTHYFLQAEKDRFEQDENKYLDLNPHLSVVAAVDRVVAQVCAEGIECNREYVMLFWLTELVVSK